VLVRLIPRTGSPIDPQVRVFRPNGDFSGCGAFDATPRLVELPCTLPGAGTHSIIVNDLQGDETGSFDVHVQRLDNPAGAANCAEIRFGDTLSRSIARRAETREGRAGRRRSGGWLRAGRARARSAPHHRRAPVARVVAAAIVVTVGAAVVQGFGDTSLAGRLLSLGALVGEALFSKLARQLALLRGGHRDRLIRPRRGPRGVRSRRGRVLRRFGAAAG
jgi:hypothetical protein